MGPVVHFFWLKRLKCAQEQAIFGSGIIGPIDARTQRRPCLKCLAGQLLPAQRGENLTFTPVPSTMLPPCLYKLSPSRISVGNPSLFQVLLPRVGSQVNKRTPNPPVQDSYMGQPSRDLIHIRVRSTRTRLFWSVLRFGNGERCHLEIESGYF